MFSADDNSVVDGTRKITISGTMKEVMWAFNAVKGLILVCKLDNVLCGAWLLWLHNTHGYYGITWLHNTHSYYGYTWLHMVTMVTMVTMVHGLKMFTYFF